MLFTPIDLTGNGNISYSLRRFERRASPFLSIIHVAFSGTYRDGSAGAPDTHFIRGITPIADDIWSPSGILLDLADLSYEWGDEMDLVLEAPNNDPFAIIVSPKFEPAISSLCCSTGPSKTVLDRDDFFDSFDAALQYLRKQVVQNWNSLVAKYPDSTTKTVFDLE